MRQRPAVEVFEFTLEQLLREGKRTGAAWASRSDEKGRVPDSNAGLKPAYRSIIALRDWTLDLWHRFLFGANPADDQSSEQNFQGGVWQFEHALALQHPTTALSSTLTNAFARLAEYLKNSGPEAYDLKQIDLSKLSVERMGLLLGRVGEREGDKLLLEAAAEIYRKGLQQHPREREPQVWAEIGREHV